MDDIEKEIIIKALECFEAIGYGRIEHIEHMYGKDGRYDGYNDAKREYNKLRNKLLKCESISDIQDNVPQIYKSAIVVKNKILKDII